MTGWNLPPGCNVSDLPGNGFDEYCAVCGNDIDSCVCPECPVCHQAGDPVCYERHGLVMSPEQLQARAEREAADAAQDEDEALYAEWIDEQQEAAKWELTCPVCGGPGDHLGALGKLDWYRCVHCGHMFEASNG